MWLFQLPALAGITSVIQEGGSGDAKCLPRGPVYVCMDCGSMEAGVGKHPDPPEYTAKYRTKEKASREKISV